MGPRYNTLYLIDSGSETLEIQNLITSTYIIVAKEKWAVFNFKP
jgi:hypothetical protein